MLQNRVWMLDADTYLLAPKMIKRLKKETRAFSPKCFLLAKGQDHYGKKKKIYIPWG